MSAADSQRRELFASLALTMAGGLIMLVCAGREWYSVTVPRQAPFAAVRTALSGHQLFPALTGLAVVAIIGAVLVLVTGGWVRRLLGGLLSLVAILTGWYAVRGLRRPSDARVRTLLGDRLSQRAGGTGLAGHPYWPVLSLLGSVLLLLAGLALLARAGSWRSGLSSRYAAPAEAADSGDPWRQLDRGEDPTISSG
jgi:uncharacterized membrane protein (TIGR02234 family)